MASNGFKKKQITFIPLIPHNKNEQGGHIFEVDGQFWESLIFFNEREEALNYQDDNFQIGIFEFPAGHVSSRNEFVFRGWI